MRYNKIMQRLNKYKRIPLSLSGYDKWSLKVCNCGLNARKAQATQSYNNASGSVFQVRGHDQYRQSPAVI